MFILLNWRRRDVFVKYSYPFFSSMVRISNFVVNFFYLHVFRACASGFSFRRTIHCVESNGRDTTLFGYTTHKRVIRTLPYKEHARWYIELIKIYYTRARARTLVIHSIPWQSCMATLTHEFSFSTIYMYVGKCTHTHTREHTCETTTLTISVLVSKCSQNAFTFIAVCAYMYHHHHHHQIICMNGQNERAVRMVKSRM